ILRRVRRKERRIAMRSLIPWRRSGGMMDTFQKEMEDVFHRFFGESEEAWPIPTNAWAPRVDVEETDKEVLGGADLPGVDQKEVDISVENGSLIIRGEKKEEKEDKKKNYHRVERFSGQFCRVLPMPAGTDPDKIAANSSKGVITVTIPKKPGVQP